MGLGLYNTIQLYSKGYCFLPYLQSKNLKNQSDVIYKCKVAGKKIYVLRGHQGARLFYDPRKVKRAGALPKYILETIFGNGIHSLDNQSHLLRKNMYKSVMTDESLQRFMDIHNNLYISYVNKWKRMKKIVLYNEMQTLLAHTAHKWVGLYKFSNVYFDQIGKHYMRMIDAFGALVPFAFHNNAVFKAKASRKWIENEIISQVVQHRSGAKMFEDGTPASIFANSNLPDKDVAMEIMNLTRPCVAVAKFVAFLGHAVYKHPFLVPQVDNSAVVKYKFLLDRWKQGDNFVNEVRRLYPFVPFLGGLTRTNMKINGMTVPSDATLLLDIRSINLDGSIYKEPMEFKPDRFNTVNIDEYNFVPQGGGPVWSSHRCPGEWITMIILKMACYHLFVEEDFTLNSDQDISINTNIIPTIPKDGVILVANVG